MKKKLLIVALETENWIGGIYYKYNIIFSFLQNNNIVENYNLYLITGREFKTLFDIYKNNIKILYLRNKNKLFFKIEKILCFLKIKPDYIYPASNNKFLFKSKAIYWIPDFQHNLFPNFFHEKEVRDRNREFIKKINSSSPLVLSSDTAYSDLMRFYNTNKKNVYIFKFVSYIEPLLKSITDSYVSKVLEKNNIKNKKIICCFNQFWQHKNHKIIFDAIDYIHNTDNHLLDGCVFVFTGKMYEYRNETYIKELLEIARKPSVKNYILNLGFIERKEQIALMKKCEFIIQPSLFEGWGTVLEDAKVLDKTVILSDVEIHREQKNDKCILFNPTDNIDLAKKIIDELGKKHIDNIDNGLRDMYEHAKIYSKAFEDLLKYN